MRRSSGILLHPTALPGPFHLGSLGREARLFVDFLNRSGQSVWQVLPLGPTGYGHSPYNALSAFAGNPALIDLRQLVEYGDLDEERLATAIRDSSDIDFLQGHTVKDQLLREAGRTFFARPPADRQRAYQDFCHANTDWLEDYCLFMALRDHFTGRVWSAWPEELRRRETGALRQWRSRLAEDCRLQRYQQFVFAEQWGQLKNYALSNGIRIFGDIPIFVAYDSADVWANQDLFLLDDLGRATMVAGVPPDYFSKTGQLWGNPLYRWERLAAEDYRWWLQRFEHQLQYSDLIRIDHFRGFQACWSVPAGEKTAANGQWVEVPGRALFEKLRTQMGDLPVVAEDLGLITPAVEKLRDEFGFPGMKVLQFAFDSGPDNPYLPENHIANCVVYTGTHDNDTTLGWWQGLSRTDKNKVRDYLGLRRPDMPWAMIRLAAASPANLCIIPCQDILSLGSEARFNTPGHAAGNWSWQMTPAALTGEIADRLARLTEKYHRKLGL